MQWSVKKYTHQSTHQKKKLRKPMAQMNLHVHSLSIQLESLRSFSNRPSF